MAVGSLPARRKVAKGKEKERAVKAAKAAKEAKEKAKAAKGKGRIRANRRPVRGSRSRKGAPEKPKT